MQHTPLTHTRFFLSEQLMHNNSLQEFAQKSNIALPVYETINEGQQHAPKFRSTMMLESYRSLYMFHIDACRQKSPNKNCVDDSKHEQRQSININYHLESKHNKCNANCQI